MVFEKRHQADLNMFLRDTRTPYKRISDTLEDGNVGPTIFVCAAGVVLFTQTGQSVSDIILVVGLFYFWWLKRLKHVLPFKMPAFAKGKDFNDKGGKPAGILFLGNEKGSGDELWLSGKDAGTHMLFLGTTGAGKTEGLKSIVSNALSWGSGFIYIDGKADTDLWASIYSLARRFGRDDDLFVLNYLTGNSDLGAVSNTINPFTTGSSSYLTNLLVSLMDEAKGENAMWKGRAVALMGALMPILVERRDKQGHPLDVKVILDSISLSSIIRLSRDTSLPERLRMGLSSTYLETLPGYVAAAFDDQGNEAPPGPNDPPRDTSTVSQQHNFLSMQFTRALQSLSGDYWHIFGSQIADVVMQDVVLNRRILVVLIPSLEKSADEAANLGKIVAASIKGMMGTTLGSSVEGDWGGVIDNKLSKSSSPFMVVFDEVGYYATQGMAVMAAQARSLGFSLIFASQDIPSMELRVREEARSITANCNLKIFGKLEESLDTQNFFEKTVGKLLTTENTSVGMMPGGLMNNFYDTDRKATVVLRDKATWGDLRDQVEGEVHMTWQSKVIAGRLFYAAPGRVKAMRVHKLLGVRAPPKPDQSVTSTINMLVKNLRDPKWQAMTAQAQIEPSNEISALVYGFTAAQKAGHDLVHSGSMAIASLAVHLQPEPAEIEAISSDEESWDDDYAALLDDESEGISAEPASFAEMPHIDAFIGPPDETRQPIAVTPAQPQLPSPDTEVDDVLEGLVRPRRMTRRDKAVAEAPPQVDPDLVVHPGLGPEVSAILKSAADRLAAGVDFATVGNAE
jgi:intracellular multiplication protein IcmO